MSNIKLMCGNNVDILKDFESESIDMILTSPPYDNLRTYNGYSFDFENIALELTRVLKKGGVIIWVVNDSVQKGSETLTSFRQAIYFKDVCKLNVNDTMIYKKKNFMPQKGNRYQNCWEYMFCYSKGKPKTFNPIMLKSKWGGCEYFGKPRVYNKEGELVEGGYAKKNHIINEFKPHENIFEYMTGSLTSSAKWKHPAMFPEQLAVDMVKSWSNENDVVLDPFCGSSTTGVACQQLNRNYIGIDISQEYIDLSERRLAENEKKL